MATSGSEIRQILAEEFEIWLGRTGSEAIYLLEVTYEILINLPRTEISQINHFFGLKLTRVKQ